MFVDFQFSPLRFSISTIDFQSSPLRFLIFTLDFQPSRSKIDESLPTNYQLGDVMHMLGALVRPRAAESKINRAFSLKKKERPTTTIRRGSTKEPPGIRQGSHFQGRCSPGMLIIKINSRNQNGTWEIRGSNTPWAMARRICLIFDFLYRTRKHQ